MQKGLDPEMEDVIRIVKERSEDPAFRELVQEREAAAKAAKIEMLMERADIPKLHRDSSFGNFQTIPANEHAYHACRRYVDDWTVDGINEGIALFGDVGVGKSYLAASVARALVFEYQVRVKFASVIHTFEMTRARFGSSTEPIADLINCDFLVLDDLGTGKPSEWTLSQVTWIVDYRINACLPMLITANAADWEGLARLLTPIMSDGADQRQMWISVCRIIDRLGAAVEEPVLMRGKSWRGRSRNKQ